METEEENAREESRGRVEEEKRARGKNRRAPSRSRALRDGIQQHREQMGDKVHCLKEKENWTEESPQMVSDF